MHFWTCMNLIIDWLMDRSNNKYVVCDILIHEQMLYQLRKKRHFIGVFTQATRDDWIIIFLRCQRSMFTCYCVLGFWI